MRRTGLFFAAMMALALPAQAQAIATMSEAQIKPILVGKWAINMGYGPGPLTIKEVQDGQLTLSGQLPLVYDRLFLNRGRINGDKITLIFSLGTAEGTVTSPIHMEGTLSFTGDTSNSTTAHWHADRVPSAP
jgi:hypothetical protein